MNDPLIFIIEKHSRVVTTQQRRHGLLYFVTYGLFCPRIQERVTLCYIVLHCATFIPA